MRMYSGSLVPVLNCIRASLNTLTVANLSMQKSSLESCTPFALIKLLQASTGSSQKVRTYSLNSLHEKDHSNREPPPSAALFKTQKSSALNFLALFGDICEWRDSHSFGLTELVYGNDSNSFGTLFASDRPNLLSSPCKITNSPSVIGPVTKKEHMFAKMGLYEILSRLLSPLAFSQPVIYPLICYC